MINSSLFYNSVEPSFILNETEVLDYNPAFRKKLLLNPSDERNIQFSDFLPHVQPCGNYSLKLLQNIIDKTFQFINFKHSLTIKNGAGEIFTMEFLFTSFTSDDQKTLIFCVCRDIDFQYNEHVLLEPAVQKVQMKQGLDVSQLLKENQKLRIDFKNKVKEEEAFYKSELKFKILAEASPAVIMQFDTSFRHTYVNSKIEDLTGIPPHKFIGRTHEELNFPLALLDLFQRCFQKVMEKKEDVRKELLLPNGKYVDWHLVPILDENKNVKSIITSLHDITYLKKIEDEVRQAKGKLSDAINIARLCTWEYDLDKREMILSPDYRNLFGIKNRRKITGEYLLKYHVIAEDQHIILEAFSEATESKESDYKNYIEYRGLRGDSIIHILASLRVIKNQLGIIVKCYGTVQDITEIRNNEQELKAYRLDLEILVEERTKELQKSESKLTDALKLVSLGTWEYNFNDKKFLIGDEVVKMMSNGNSKGLGNIFSTEEFFKYLHPDDYSILQNFYSFILKVNDPEFIDYLECRIVRPDGEIRNLYISLKIDIDKITGRHLKHYGTIQDITNIRRTEAEKERLIAISEATSDIIAISNSKGGILYLNKAGKTFFGIENNIEISYLNINSLQQHKSKKILKKVGLEQAIRKGIWSGENLIYGKSGYAIPVSQVIIAHQAENGSIDCFSTILRDISRQKNIERDLLYKNNELDTFVYRASHDLRGPIASLLGLHTIVTYDISDPVSIGYFEMYNQQILRLNNIIISLIEISRIKDREAIKATINFKNIITECINSFPNLKNFQNLEFLTHVDPNLKFKSDISIVTTIIQNLIENAIKYSKPDEPGSVVIEVKDLSGSVSLKVSDNGIGIDSSIQDKIFNMFFRGTEQGIGSGLGLYILKNAVEKIKGKIILESILDRGTTFTIILPNQ